MTLFGKSIVAFIVLIIFGIGGFVYATRPVIAPSEDLSASQANAGDGAAAENPSSASDSASSTASTTMPAVSTFRIAKGTVAEFRIDEVLRGKDFTVIGTTSDVSGSVEVDAANPEDSAIGIIKINARTFKTDSSNRDSAIARFMLKSEDAANEFVTFSAKSVSGLPADAAALLAKGDSVSFKVKGDLLIAGITKSVIFDAKFSQTKDGRIKGQAEAKIKRSDFKIVIPNVPFVANVPDEFLIKISAVLAK